MSLSLTPSNTVTTSVIDSIALAGAEISAFDPTTDRFFVTSGSGLIIVDASDPANLAQVGVVDLTQAPFGFANNINSVTAKNGVIAVAVADATKTSNGKVFLLDASGNLLKAVDVGALPDMLTFTPDGKKILVANEGERSLTDDAPGSVSIIDLTNGAADATVRNVGFTGFDGQEAKLLKQGVRIFEGKSVSMDVEPEYIAVAPDGKTAMVTLQEANAVAILDIEKAEITKIAPLGLKKQDQLLLDYSDRDGGYNPIKAPVLGMYMPDAIASYQSGKKTFYVIANEGDDRNDFIDGEEAERLKDLTLDARKFKDAAALQADSALGRLNTPNPDQVGARVSGDTDGDGDIDQILAYGARSFSILNNKGKVIFDSGDHIERFIANSRPDLFDDGRSDNKGPEPEGVTIASIGASVYALVGLERSNSVMVYDVTKAKKVEFVGLLNNAGDISPEGLTFVGAADSPTGVALVGVTNEVSNTLTLYSLTV